jgi:folate-dependent tRNA-U54 methylase TrmFO/GidA
MRQAGLESPEREFSPENIAFKILRRDNALGKLNNLQQKVYDNEASLG